MKILFLFTLFCFSLQFGINCTRTTQNMKCGDIYVCKSETNLCGFCIEGGDECTNFPTYVCKADRYNQTYCGHKNLFPDVNIYDILSIIVSSWINKDLLDGRYSLLYQWCRRFRNICTSFDCHWWIYNNTRCRHLQGNRIWRLYFQLDFIWNQKASHRWPSSDRL